MNSMAEEPGDRLNLKEVGVNAECTQVTPSAEQLTSPLGLANSNLQITQTELSLANENHSGPGAALAISSLNTGGETRGGNSDPMPSASPFVSAAEVPEPTTLFLMGTGLVGIAMLLRRKLKPRKRN
jgi:hypothetical protein